MVLTWTETGLTMKISAYSEVVDKRLKGVGIEINMAVIMTILTYPSLEIKTIKRYVEPQLM